MNEAQDKCQQLKPQSFIIINKKKYELLKN